MKKRFLAPFVVSSLCASLSAHAAVDLIAVGNIDGAYEDLASQTAAPTPTPTTTKSTTRCPTSTVSIP